MRPACSILFVLLGLLAAAPGAAQDREEPADARERRPPAGTTDLPDLWRHLKGQEAPEADTSEPDRRALVVAPALGARPSTGLTLGINGNAGFFRGDPATTHISSLVGGFRVSQKKQVLSNVRFSVFTDNDRWFLQGDNRLNWTSLNTYAFGSDPAATSANVKFTFVRLYETAYRTVAPGLFVGGGVNVNVRSNIRAADESAPFFDRSSFFAYSAAHGLSPTSQTSSGTNVGVIYDTRDNAINAWHGTLASAVYRTFFRGFLGGDATYQQVSIDVRRFVPLTRSATQRLAFWLLTDVIAGGAAPFFDLPTTGGDIRSGRGYTEGLNRGSQLVYGEMEYRGNLTSNGLLGLVAFVNATTVGSADAGERLFDTYAPAAGVGFRVLLNKRSRTNLCTDFAWGRNGSSGFYLGLQEAF